MEEVQGSSPCSSTKQKTPATGWCFLFGLVAMNSNPKGRTLPVAMRAIRISSGDGLSNHCNGTPHVRLLLFTCGQFGSDFCQFQSKCIIKGRMPVEQSIPHGAKQHIHDGFHGHGILAGTGHLCTQHGR